MPLPTSDLRPLTSDRPRIGYTSQNADDAYFHEWQHDYWFSIFLGGGEPVRLYPELVDDYDPILDTLDGLAKNSTKAIYIVRCMLFH